MFSRVVPSLASGIASPVELARGATIFLDVAQPSGGSGKASLSSSAINMANTVLGTGLLAIPRCLSFAGLVPGILLIFFSAGVAVVTNVFISDAAAAIGRPASFRRLSDAAMDRLSLIVNGAVIVAAAGVGISYFIIASDGIVDALPPLLNSPAPPRWSVVLAVAAMATPLSLLRSLDSLRATSLIAILILLAITGLVLAYALPTPDKAIFIACPGDGNASPTSCPPGPILAYNGFNGAMNAMPTLALAYTCQMSTPTLWNEMERPTRARMSIVYASALGTGMVLYLLVGVFGYVTFGDRVQPNILSSYPMTPALSLARIGLSFVVLFSFPIQAMALRSSVAAISEVLIECFSGAGEVAKRGAAIKWDAEVKWDAGARRCAEARRGAVAEQGGYTRQAEAGAGLVLARPVAMAWSLSPPNTWRGSPGNGDREADRPKDAAVSQAHASTLTSLRGSPDVGAMAAEQANVAAAPSPAHPV
jgi:amino acid permease